MEKIFADISPKQALLILGRLWERGGAITDAIKEELQEILKAPTVDVVAQEVFAVLDGIDVDEFRDRLAPSRSAYSPPEEMAMEMIHEELAQFRDQMEKYRASGMLEEEKTYCMGVLKGIYRFKKESQSQFMEWASELPAEYFESLLNRWWKRGQSREHRTEMYEFIREFCPEWASS